MVLLQGVLVVTYAVVLLFLFVSEHVVWELKFILLFYNWSDSVPISGSEVFCFGLKSIKLALSFS